MGSKSKEGFLVAHAVLEDGLRQVLAVQLGPKESETAWRGMLDDLVRRRTRVAEPFPTERSALALVWACLEEDRLKWRGVRITPKLMRAITQARESVQNEPISIPAAENHLAVA